MGFIDLSIVAPSGLFGQNLELTCIAELKNGAEELAQMEEILVGMREPRLTGTLQHDVVAISNPDLADPELVLINLAQAGQLEEYGRVYGGYVEGPGQLTEEGPDPRTMPSPSHAFERILTDDLGPIKAWGDHRLEIALIAYAAGKGLR